MNPFERAVIASQRSHRRRQIGTALGCLVAVGVVAIFGMRMHNAWTQPPASERLIGRHDAGGAASDSSVATSTSPTIAVPAEPLTGTASSISKIPLPLLLISTRRGSTPRAGTARIGTSARNPQTYVAGALLVNGARLLEIHEQYVVLERAGQQAKLYLARLGNRPQSQLVTVGGESPQPRPAPVHHTEVLAFYLRPSPLYESDVLKGYQGLPRPAPRGVRTDGSSQR